MGARRTDFAFLSPLAQQQQQQQQQQPWEGLEVEQEEQEEQEEEELAFEEQQAAPFEHQGLHQQYMPSWTGAHAPFSSAYQQQRLQLGGSLPLALHERHFGQQPSAQAQQLQFLRGMEQFQGSGRVLSQGSGGGGLTAVQRLALMKRERARGSGY